VVGTDGIRSSVRGLLVVSVTRVTSVYCDIGNCPLAVLNGIDSSLLDSATVFQTTSGNEQYVYMIQNQ
jgi:hypothetical protein